MTDGLWGSEEEEVVLGHEFVGDAHEFAEHRDGRFGDADVVIKALGHLVDAIESFEEGHEHDDLFGLSFLPLEVSANEDVEQLVCAAEFNVGLNHDGIPSLNDGVLDFVETHGIASVDTISEVFAMEHLLEGHAAVETDDVNEGHFGEPVAVEDDLGFLAVEDFEGLFAEGLCISEHFFATELGPRFGATGRVANHGCEVADDEDGLMSELLELAEFFEADGEAEVDVGSGGIDAEFDVEGASEAQFCQKFVFGEDFCGASAKGFELGFGSLHEGRENESVM
jgi:hypothetical protein